ncbi:hypothetical protein LTR56_009845 [Elasticomyces elasticus]|nr:hypothetical protein LTR56_009845 [Elasticomyces elasticus]KAK3659161.1 hypothetical protein LTR22_008624 [Elasticomyces elasticus]KAK4923161.1 hypothetical protein LTR49_009629 [Elasticomyces elasticus]KAK5761546.1 hypothetical protein LTS12_008338 [Elasticomyces elasticus]
MAVQQDTEPPILKLPTELVEAVGDNVTAADLRALKLTCRFINTNVQRAFIRAHFTEQSFILGSPESMQALVEITEHEVYSKVIRKLNLFVLKMPQKPPHPRGRYGRRAAAEEQSPRDRSTRVHKRDVARLYEQNFKKQEQYWRHDEWSVALRKALLNLATTTNGVSIEILGDKSKLRSACGMRALGQQLEQEDNLDAVPYSTVPRTRLLEAVSEGACPIVGFRYEVVTLFSAADWAERHHPGLFSGLRTVDLIAPPDHDPVELVVTRLGCAAHLEHLTLRTGYSWYGIPNYNNVLMGTAHLPKLREVAIIGSYPDPQHLTAFCTRHGKTLTQLTIDASAYPAYGGAVAHRERARAAIEEAWSMAKLAGIKFELS